LRRGKLAREGFSPSREKVAYRRRLRASPTGRALRACGERILPRSPCHPGDVHGRRTAEVLYGGLAEDIVTTPGAVMMD
jgi:hypothetical protein